MKHYLTALLFLIAQYITCNKNNCQLNIGLNKYSTFMGKGIYYNGEIDALFNRNATVKYRSPIEKEIDYFYIAEKIGANILNSESNDKKIEIESSNTSVSMPSFKYISHKSIVKEVQTGEIEITYNCKVNEKAESIITLKFTPHSCPLFELQWLKECKLNSTSSSSVAPAASLPLPLIDISINRDDVLINGTQINSNIFNNHSGTPYVIFPRRLNLYFSNHNQNKQYIIRPIEINHSPLVGFGYIVRGYLVNGGQITYNKNTVIIDFICLRAGMVDIEILIPFENSNQSIKMYFKKECGEYRRGITIGLLSFLFWFFVTVVIVLIVLCCMAYSLENPFMCLELYNSLMLFFRNIKYKAMQYNTIPSKPINAGSNTKQNGDGEIMNEDDDNNNNDLSISYQIKVLKTNKDTDNNEEMPINVIKDYQIDRKSVV